MSDDPIDSMRKFVSDTDEREARYARGRAHEVFDRLWQNGYMTRTAAYRFLAKFFRVEEIHFAQMTKEQCERAIKACKQLLGEK